MCLYCDRPAQQKGLCSTHEHRRRGGLPMAAPLKPRRQYSFGVLNREITYDSAHSRCKRLWGSASNYPCVGCGGESRDWAYDGTDPTELKGFSSGRDHRRSESLMAYSIWPEFFMPVCQGCHAVFDNPDAEPVGVVDDYEPPF